MDGTLERCDNVRQFSGEFFTRRRLAATDEIPAGIGGGSRREERIFFLGAFGHRNRVF
jgi:hypothetical protein